MVEHNRQECENGSMSLHGCYQMKTRAPGRKVWIGCPIIRITKWSIMFFCSTTEQEIEAHSSMALHILLLGKIVKHVMKNVIIFFNFLFKSTSCTSIHLDRLYNFHAAVFYNYTHLFTWTPLTISYQVS